MNRTATHRVDDLLVRLSNRATIWILGTGLLSLHASVFTLSIVGLVFWNIYDAPNDLWVDEIFRRWGAVLAFHAIVAAAGWTAWKLMRAERQAIDAARTNWTTPVLPASTQPLPQARWQPPPAGPIGTPPPTQRSESVAKRVLVSYTTWSTAMARRTRTMVASSASHLTAGRKESARSSTSDAPPSIHSWPEGPIRVREEQQEFIARFGGHATPTGVGWTPPPPDHTPVNGGPESASPPVAKDAGQTWVEVATSNWIAPKDEEHLADPKRANGHHPPEEPSSPETPADGASPVT